MYEQLTNMFVLLTLGFGLWLNTYKLKIMYACHMNHEKYKIFPWSRNPKISKSDPLWLMFHLIVAFVLLTLASYNTLYPNWRNNETVFELFKTFNFLFTILICINFTNFGVMSKLAATVINLVPIIIMNLAYMQNWQYSDEIYFLILAIPVFIEGISYMKS